jgi:uncharacterized protein YdaU (DUF1376 family)
MKVRRVDWYPADWLEGTAELSYFDEGVYADICNLIYARGGPIAVLLLQSRGKCHGNQLNAALVRLEQAGKIVRNGPEIDQKRCRNELERRQKTIRKAQENGAKGGRPNDLDKPDGFSDQKAINLQPSSIIDSPSGESPPLISPPLKPERSNGRQERGTRLAADWQPSSEDCAFAEAECGLDIGRVGDSFRDYWIARPGAGGIKLDWSATFRNWCRKERDSRSVSGGRSGANGSRPGGIAAAMRDVLGYPAGD